MLRADNGEKEHDAAEDGEPEDGGDQVVENEILGFEPGWGGAAGIHCKLELIFYQRLQGFMFKILGVPLNGLVGNMSMLVES